ncbi:hypothetical protein D3C76_466500 [compost metagenome]
MNKLITSLACGTVLSMSLLGVGYASTASGTTGMGGTSPVYNGSAANDRMTNMGTTGTRMMNEQGNTMMNNTTGTLRNNDTIMRDKVRTGDNTTVSPLANTTQTGRYRATATTTNAADNDNDFDWGWLGLVGLLGLAGMRNRSGERERR